MRSGWSYQTQVFPKWEGPYIVEKAHRTGHYWLKDQVGIKAYSPLAELTLRNTMLNLVKISFCFHDVKLILCSTILISL